MTAKRHIAVIGAGIVGVTSALELQSRGHQVVLFDGKPAGSETSFGNAGVLSDASIMVVNNPQLFLTLPKLLFGRNLALRYSVGFLCSRLSWLIRFLSFANKRHMEKAATVLRALQVYSIKRHNELIEKTGMTHLLNRNGWLRLYRSKKQFDAGAAELAFMRRQGVSAITCSAGDIAAMEPGLKPVFYAGVLFPDTFSVSSPSELTRAYLTLFESCGGEFKQLQVTSLQPSQNPAWTLTLADQSQALFDDVVIATGPWARSMLAPLGYNIPMAWERGYHQHVSASADSIPLSRPVYDVESGFVLAQHKEGLRVLTGVEMTYRQAPPNYSQIRAAITAARDIIDFGRESENEPWLGCRPTLVDSLPMIGAATKHRGLWFNFGHQHIGLSTSTGCADILADLMDDKVPPVDHLPFRADRFSL